MSSPGLLHNANYVRYRVARVVSILGSQLSAIAYPLIVLHLGGSAAQAGAVFTAGMVTRVACQLPGGILTDRFDRRLLMIQTDVIRLAAVGSIPLVSVLDHGHVAYPQLIIVAVVEGAATAVFGPSATALIRELVPKEDLPRALGQTQGFSAATTMAGPALGGLAFELHPMLPFVADASSYGLSAVLLIGLRITSARAVGPGADRRVTAGMRWLLGMPAVLRILAFASVVNLVAAASQISVVVVLRQRGTQADVIGLVLAGIGIGSVLGALSARHVMAKLDPARLCLALGAVWTAGFASFAASSSPWLIGPVLAVLFVLSPAAGIMLGTITMGEAPKDLLGRITTAQQMVSLSLATVGPVLAGVALQTVGPAKTWLGMGACCLVVTVVTIGPMLLRGSSRDKESTDSPEDEAAAPLQQR